MAYFFSETRGTAESTARQGRASIIERCTRPINTPSFFAPLILNTRGEIGSPDTLPCVRWGRARIGPNLRFGLSAAAAIPEQMERNVKNSVFSLKNENVKSFLSL